MVQQPLGLWCLGKPDQGFPQALLNHPCASGFILRRSWASIEPQENVLNWTLTDEVLDSNKPVCLSIGPGKVSPSWLQSAGVPYSPAGYPVAISSQFRYFWRRLIRALADHCADRANILRVIITGIAGPAAVDEFSWDAAWSWQEVINYTKDFAFTFAYHFPGKALSLLTVSSNDTYNAQIASELSNTFPNRMSYLNTGANSIWADPNVQNWGYSGHQLVCAASTDQATPEFPNGRIRGDPNDPPGNLRRAFDQIKSVNGKFAEVYAADFVDSRMQEAIAYGASLFQ